MQFLVAIFMEELSNFPIKHAHARLRMLQARKYLLNN